MTEQLQEALQKVFADTITKIVCSNSRVKRINIRKYVPCIPDGYQVEKFTEKKQAFHEKVSIDEMGSLLWNALDVDFWTAECLE